MVLTKKGNKILKFEFSNQMKQLIFFLLSLLFFQSCSVLDPIEKAPSYLYLKPFEMVDSSYVYHGSIRHKIKDGWVYINDEYLGAFELPAKIPILADGPTKVVVSPGILTNGIAGTRSIYPGYRPYAKTINFSPLKTDSLELKTFYNSYLKFVVLEDFELSNSFENVFNADTTFYLDTLAPFEGRRSLAWALEDSFPTVNFRTKTDFSIAGGGRPAFMELDYRCNNPFSIYLDVSSAGGLVQYQFFIVNPKETWNKLYLNLTPAIAELTQNSTIRLRFYSYFQSGTNKKGWGEIDNVKVFYTDN
jgi:hypothetical protein